MKTYNNLWETICSFENIELAYNKARKGKSKKLYVIEFEKNLHNNLSNLRNELLSDSYKPKQLETFIIRDPKTRKISKSDFRDRIVHHALINVVEPMFDKSFIYDSYANRKGKGALKALERFDKFKMKISNNLKLDSYFLKCDIKHYFEEVDKKVLLSIISRKIKDSHVLSLINKILDNHHTDNLDKGMPLGNLTSQFFANVYLNELDQFVKHGLKVIYYIRYVDDFIILSREKDALEYYKIKINNFLKYNLSLELHKDKSKIGILKNGVDLLGFRVFYHYKLLRKSNIRKIRYNLNKYSILYNSNKISYDEIYNSLQSWFAYSKLANTCKLRKTIAKNIEEKFPNEVSSIELNRYIKALH